MDNKNHRHVFSAYMIVTEITVVLLTGCVAHPRITNRVQYVEFNESIPIGTPLFNLSADDYDDPRNKLSFSPSDFKTAEYVNITQSIGMNPITALITLKKELDRETNEGNIELKFSLVDLNGNTIYTSVRLYILDACDETPRFTSLLYMTEINETDVNSPIVVYRNIHATDTDNGLYAVVFYTMTPKAESPYWKETFMERFSIDRENGNILLMQDLDYENNSFYQFTVSATDICNLTATPADLIIRVKDIQDTPPFFIALPYMKDIPEGNYTKEPVLRVTAFDGDRGIPNKILYFIKSRSECAHNSTGSCSLCDTLFTIDRSTGEITITGNLDWSMQDVQSIYGICTIIVEAREDDNNTENQNKTSRTTVTVIIRDVTQSVPFYIHDICNEPPNFDRPSYTLEINEVNIRNERLVFGGIHATHGNNGMNAVITYSMEPKTDSGDYWRKIYNETFRIDPASGSLYLRKSLDYEHNSLFQFTLHAHDICRFQAVPASLTIIVKDVQEDHF